jgi:hypothetical protein
VTSTRIGPICGGRGIPRCCITTQGPGRSDSPARGTKTVLAETAAIAIGAGQVLAVKLSRTAGGGWTTAVVAE